MTDLAGLIERLEKATGYDRNLDFAIARALGWTIGSPHYVKSPDGTPHGVLPNWTSSIDAAMTLVPEGWNRRASETDKHWWWAELREGYETSYNRVEIGQSPSLPVSICIAALKARSLPAI